MKSIEEMKETKLPGYSVVRQVGVRLEVVDAVEKPGGGILVDQSRISILGVMLLVGDRAYQMAKKGNIKRFNELLEQYGDFAILKRAGVGTYPLRSSDVLETDKKEKGGEE